MTDQTLDLLVRTRRVSQEVFTEVAHDLKKIGLEALTTTRLAKDLGPALQAATARFSGDRIVEDATLAAKAIEHIGGTSKLTVAELKSVSTTAQQAAEKLRAMGQDVPESLEKIATAAEHDARALAAIDEAWNGRRIIDDATRVAAAVERIGGASKLTATEQGSVNRTVNEAIEKYRALGQTAPAALVQLERATRQAVQPTSELAAKTQELQRSLSGQGAIRDAQAYATAIERLGGVSKLTASEQSAANRSIGEALAKYKALGQEAPASLVQLHQATATQTTLLGGLMAKLGPLGPAIAGAFSVGAILGAVKGVGDFADQIVNLSDETKIGIERLQAFNYVGAGAGIAVGQLANSAQQLARRVAEGDDSTVAAFDKLGLSIDQLRAQTPDEIMLSVADATMAVKDPLEQVRLSFDLFGRDGSRNLRLIRNDFRLLVEQAEKDGPIIDQALLKRAAEWNNWWSQMTIRRQALQAEAVDWVSRIRMTPGLTGGMPLFSIEPRPEPTASKPTNTPATPPVVATVSYREQIAKARAELDKLTASQREEIRAAQQLGASTGDVAKKFKLTEGALRLLNEETSAHQKRLQDLSAEQQRFNEQLSKMFGLDKIVEAQHAIELFFAGQKKGLVASTEQLLALNDTVDVGIETMLRNGRVVELAWYRIWEATKTADMGVQGYVDSLQQLPEAANAIQPPPIPRFDQVGMNSLAWVDALDKTLGGGPGKGPVDSFLRRAGFSDIGKQIPGLVVQGLTGGGGMRGAMEAAGAIGGQSLMKGIFGTVGDKAAGVIGTGLVKNLTGVVGDLVGSAIPVAGALIGPLVGKLLSKIGGGPSQEELQGREVVKQYEAALHQTLTTQQRAEAGGRAWAMTTIAVRDAYLATGRTAAEAETVVKRLWDSSRSGAEAAKRAAEEVDAVMREQKADQDRLNAAIQKYGFSLDQIGPALRRQKLGEEALDIAEDWRVLVGAQVDLNAVNDKLAPRMQEYLQMCIKTGTEVPVAMRPMLEQMIKTGDLLDENGNAVTDLGQLQVKWARTMGEEFDRFTRKLARMYEQIFGIKIALDDLPSEVNVAVNFEQGSVPQPPSYGAPPQPQPPTYDPAYPTGPYPFPGAEFHRGGVITAHRGRFLGPPLSPGEVVVKGLVGEGILSQFATANWGGKAGIDAMNRGATPGDLVSAMIQQFRSNVPSGATVFSPDLARSQVAAFEDLHDAATPIAPVLTSIAARARAMDAAIAQLPTTLPMTAAVGALDQQLALVQGRLRVEMPRAIQQALGATGPTGPGPAPVSTRAPAAVVATPLPPGGLRSLEEFYARTGIVGGASRRLHLQSFAEEGRVTRPTLAIIGDAPEPEFVLRESTLQRMAQAATPPSSGPRDVHLHLSFPNAGVVDAAAIERLVDNPRFVRAVLKATHDDAYGLRSGLEAKIVPRRTR